MAGPGPRILFVPVSGPLGIGEFARVRAIGKALVARWPAIEQRYLVHRQAPYTEALGELARQVPASPTLCTPEVLDEIARFRPQVVVFDNSGRTAQLRAARAVGAHVIYVSSRGRQRYKAFRLRWMRMIDEHWISYSPRLAGPLGWSERLKLRLLQRPTLRFLDAVLAPAEPFGAGAVLATAGVPGDAALDLLIVPGGGSQFPDARVTPSMFAVWGESLAARGWNVLLVAGPSFTAPVDPGGRLRVVRQVEGGVLTALLARSRLVLVNGGDTMVQALALNRPCVAVPIALDQAQRITRAAALGAVRAPELNAVTDCCDALLRDAAALGALEAEVREAGFLDAMPTVLSALGRMLGRL